MQQFRAAQLPFPKLSDQQIAAAGVAHLLKSFLSLHHVKQWPCDPQFTLVGPVVPACGAYLAPPWIQRRLALGRIGCYWGLFGRFGARTRAFLFLQLLRPFRLMSMPKQTVAGGERTRHGQHVICMAVLGQQGCKNALALLSFLLACAQSHTLLAPGPGTKTHSEPGAARCTQSGFIKLLLS